MQDTDADGKNNEWLAQLCRQTKVKKECREGACGGGGPRWVKEVLVQGIAYLDGKRRPISGREAKGVRPFAWQN